MDILKNYIDNTINVQCTMSNYCSHGTHSVIANVIADIKRLKHDKNDGAYKVISKHLFYSGRRLSVDVSLLFTTMFRHRCISTFSYIFAQCIGSKISACSEEHCREIL